MPPSSFHLEDGGSKVLQNAGILGQHYTASQMRKSQATPTEKYMLWSEIRVNKVREIQQTFLLENQVLNFLPQLRGTTYT